MFRGSECTVGVREGSDGKLSRVNNPIEQGREVNRSEITVYRGGGRVVEDVKANMLQDIMQRTKQVTAMTMRVMRMSPRSPRPETNREDPIERRDGRKDAS